MVHCCITCIHKVVKIDFIDVSISITFVVNILPPLKETEQKIQSEDFLYMCFTKMFRMQCLQFIPQNLKVNHWKGSYRHCSLCSFAFFIEVQRNTNYETGSGGIIIPVHGVVLVERTRLCACVTGLKRKTNVGQSQKPMGFFSKQH